MITVMSRLCYQIDTPDFLRRLVYGDSIASDHHELKPYLKDLLVIAVRTVQGKWNDDWDPDKTITNGSKDWPVDLDMEESTDSDEVFNYYSK